ncbi:1,9-bis(guanidino)-5-aza-nonane synthase [Salinisphaera sp. SWV1]|uniref:1,9-bis(guanidino)-5-aza-nonane synthase n=1 Tax=Salinisphaera sp. SWV1 TaxID=3454139 RepID=UPI003F825A0C
MDAQARVQQESTEPHREALLRTPVEHFDIAAVDTRPILAMYEQMRFTAAELSRAYRILSAGLTDDDCCLFLSLAGSTSAAGCMNIYRDLVDAHMVDAIVATGASIIDMDLFEALGFRHFHRQDDLNDDQLREHEIDRIYDTYIDERDLRICDETIKTIAEGLEPGAYSSREFIREIGRWLDNEGSELCKKDSLIAAAYRNNVPIFCPAFTDSSAGFGLVAHQTERPDAHVTIDSVRDFRELTTVKTSFKESALFMVGGGTPKNFVQDTVVCADLLGHPSRMHKYTVQITVADPRDGACSSSTLSEACSWGKVDRSLEQMVYSEASLSVPLLASALFHQHANDQRKPRNAAASLSSEQNAP